MTIEEIKTEIRNLFDRRAETLSRDHYRELVEEIHADMQSRLDCIEDEDAEK